MKFKITHHRDPADRTLVEKVARRFILPPHGPRSLPWGRWTIRDARLKRLYPLRYWVWDTVPDFFRDEVRGRYRKAKNWLRFRTWDRYDIVRLEIEKNYHDPDSRLFHANFQILKDFVEIELASMAESCENDHDRQSKMLDYFSKAFRRNRRRNIRRPDLGISHLDWEISDCPGHQADAAKEKKALYLWWTKIRPLRADPYGSLFNDPREDTSVPLFNRPHNRDLTEARRALEAFYEDEDEEMLVRLIKIRRSLWT